MNKLEKKNNVNTMILCAGRGQRMRYKTKYIAKPLIKIQNQPILKTNINYLSSIGIKNCIINNSYIYRFKCNTHQACCIGVWVNICSWVVMHISNFFIVYKF